MKTWERLARERGLEILVGVILTCAGLAISETGGWTGTIGTILAAVGGIQISWVAATYLTEDRTSLEHRQRVGVQARQLGLAIAQIQEAISRTHQGVLDPNTGLALIQQAQTALSGVLNELQSVHGDAFDPETFIETAEQIRDLGAKMTQVAAEAAGSDSSKEISQFQEELRDLVSKLQGSTPSRYVTHETAHCPECGTEVGFDLGSIHGDSKMPTCPECSLRFHAHRAAEGEVFVRRPGGIRNSTTTVSTVDARPSAPNDPT